MADGNSTYIRIFIFAEESLGPLTEFLNGLPARRIMTFVHLCNQTNILIGIFALKPLRGDMPMFDDAGISILFYQASDGLSGVAADLDQVANNNALVGFFKQWVMEPYQLMLDPLVTLFLNRIELKDDSLGAIKEL